MGTRIKCKHCNDIIESLYTHDFKSCKCGAIFVDGGNSYMRCGWPGGNREDHFEIVEREKEDNKETKKTELP